jgi:hypothetical protein
MLTVSHRLGSLCHCVQKPEDPHVFYNCLEASEFPLTIFWLLDRKYYVVLLEHPQRAAIIFVQMTQFW